MATKKQPAKGKRRAKSQVLPNVMTGPQVQKALGKVSHVTVVKLFKRGKLKRVGKAKQQGGGYLYDTVTTLAFAKTYKPQRNPPPKKKQRGGVGAKGHRVGTGKRAPKKVKRLKGRVR